MAVPPVADDIYDYVLGHLLAETQGQTHGVDHGFRIVAVDVKHGNRGHLGHIRGKEGGAGVPAGGGKADLVVDDHVDRAAGVVAPQLGEVENFSHHSLSAERGVAVQDHRQNPFGGFHEAAPTGLTLHRPGLSLHHPIDTLQVAGIGNQGYVD